MQAMQHRAGYDLPTDWRCYQPFWLTRDALLDPLIWPGMIEVPLIFLHDPTQVSLAQDQEVVEALSPQAAQKTFTDRICFWCLVRGSQHLDSCRHSLERIPIFAVVVTNQIPGAFTIMMSPPVIAVPSTCLSGS